MLLRLERLWQFSTNVCFARRQIQLKAEAESISPNNQSQPINWSYVAGRKMFVLFFTNLGDDSDDDNNGHDDYGDANNLDSERMERWQG